MDVEQEFRMKAWRCLHELYITDTICFHVGGIMKLVEHVVNI